ENGRVEVAQQLEVGGHASSDRHVSLQVADACVAAGDRPQLRRQAPLDRYSFHPEGGGPAKEGWKFQQLDRQFSRRISLIAPVFHSVFPQGLRIAVDGRGWNRKLIENRVRNRLFIHVFCTT